MEEEGARRRAQKGGANRGFLQNLNESDEEEDIPKQAPTGTGAKVAAKRAVQGGDAYDGRAGQRDRGRRTGGGPKPFELDLDGATLLGRRHKRGVDGGVGTYGGSPLALGTTSSPEDHPIETPMSPMRVD